MLDGLVDFCEQMSKGNGTADVPGLPRLGPAPFCRWRFPWPWGYPKMDGVFDRENFASKWMRTEMGPPFQSRKQETPVEIRQKKDRIAQNFIVQNHPFCGPCIPGGSGGNPLLYPPGTDLLIDGFREINPNIIQVLGSFWRHQWLRVMATPNQFTSDHRTNVPGIGFKVASMRGQFFRN